MNTKKLNDELNRSVNTINRVYRKLAQKAGISDSIFWTLYILWTSQEPLTSAQIIQAVDLPKQTLSSALSQIRKQALVTQTTSRAPLVLTEKGRQYCRDIYGPVVSLEEEILQQMGEENARSFVRLCSLYASLFQEKEATV